MGVGAVLVRNGIDIEEYGTGQAFGFIVGAGIAAIQPPAGIH